MALLPNGVFLVSGISLTLLFINYHSMDQRIINLYDEYTHKPLNRNEFLRRLAMLAGGTAAALTLLPLLEVNYAHAAVTPQEDLFTERIS